MKLFSTGERLVEAIIITIVICLYDVLIVKYTLHGSAPSKSYFISVLGLLLHMYQCILNVLFDALHERMHFCITIYILSYNY